ncbi:MAG: type II toxin-antitoxin system HicA family toxin [Firmicutes bacterium]|nr:type II toxin-antitoxin system HicA family toxin [Bacillota bacterium]
MRHEVAHSGWRLLRQGKHEIWINGELTIPVPRHDEINEMTARGILKDARTVKGKRKEN